MASAKESRLRKPTNKLSLKCSSYVLAVSLGWFKELLEFKKLEILPLKARHGIMVTAESAAYVSRLSIPKVF